MILRIRDKKGRVTHVSRLCKIVADGDDNTISADASNNTITITDSNVSYAEWYQSFLNRKLLAMHSGGVVDKDTVFVHGVRSYVYTGDRPYLKVFSGVTPDTDGNIQLLPGKTLDVALAGGNRISLEQLDIQRSSTLAEALADINRCVWYLYHSFNTLLYRMHVWAPNITCYPMFTKARLLGVIQEYQAVVAAWNLKVWRSSFLWSVSQGREALVFDVGYISFNCVPQSVHCTVVIYNPNYAKDVEDYPSSNSFFTLYKNAEGGKIAGTTVTMIKSAREQTDGGDYEYCGISGKGSDDWAEESKPWSSITLDITINSLSQGEYYKASFAVAVAQNEWTAKYYSSIDGDSPPSPLMITTTWFIDDETATGTETNNDPVEIRSAGNIPKLELYEDVEEEYIQ